VVEPAGATGVTAVCDEALALMEQGICPVPIPRGEKAPTAKKWQDRRFTLDTIRRHFAGDKNLGIVLGERSGGLIDADLDCAEAIAVAQSGLMPETGWVFGRQSCPSAHWMYYVGQESCGRTKRFHDPHGGLLLEFRATGSQTVVPPSALRRKDGPGLEPLEWQQHETPARIDRAELYPQIAQVAAAALLVKHYPGVGERNELAKAVTGVMLRLLGDVPQVERFVRAVAVGAGDEQADNRVLVPRLAADRLRDNQPVLGMPGLERIVGAKIADRVFEWLGGKEQRNQATKQQATETKATEYLSVGFSREGRIIFDLARRVRGRPESRGAIAADFQPEVEQLWRDRLTHLPWEVVWEEWLKVFSRVHTPVSPPLPTTALDNAPQVVLPPSCGHFSPRMVQLAQLAVALQDHAGEGTCFALSARAAATYLGSAAYSNAWTSLQALCGAGFLECIDRGVSGKGGTAALYVLDDLGRRASMGERLEHTIG